MKQATFNANELMHRSESLISAASNRYQVTVQVAKRAKKHRDNSIEYVENPFMKPVTLAVFEMSDELTMPEVIET